MRFRFVCMLFCGYLVLMNNLIGVLMRFRREKVAAMCDVEQMFHSFYVSPAHKNFLCFLWFKGNNLSKPIVEYRMNVHLFGNDPSPAVATYGLRRTALDCEEASQEIYSPKLLRRPWLGFFSKRLTSNRVIEKCTGLTSHHKPMSAQGRLKLSRGNGGLPRRGPS